MEKTDYLSEEEYGEVWKKVERNLARVLDGDIGVDELVERRKRNYASYGRKVPEYPPGDRV